MRRHELNLAERLAEYVSSMNYADLDENVILEAKKRLIDTLGCAIGAFRKGPVRMASNVALTNNPGRIATLLGTRRRTSPDMAAFVNGIMVRYFDYNDTYLSKEPAHPSDNIPPCISVGEQEGSTGKDLLLAMILAYEIQCRLCDAADIRHRGWDHVCYGLVSSSLAAGKLMELPQERLTQAVNIALNGHIAMRQVRAGELSEWKGCSFANAARNAVFAALLAREGLSGPSPIFEGEMGFFKQVSGPFEVDIEGFGGRAGRFKLPETYIKYFPAEYHSQSAIWAALEARRKFGSPDKVESVKVETHEAGLTILGKDREKWTPSTKETADHSLPYIVGMALLKGKIDNASYSPRNLKDPQIIRLMQKISVVEDRGLTDLYPRSIANRVTVRLDDGGIITEQVNNPRGHRSNPMTEKEVESKFIKLTHKFLSRPRADKVLDFVWNIEKRDRIKPLLEVCAFV